MWIWIAVLLLGVVMGLVATKASERVDHIEQRQFADLLRRSASQLRLSADLAAIKARLADLEESHQALALDTARRNLQTVTTSARRRARPA